MNKFDKIFKDHVGNRDIVFNSILNYFNNGAINVLELGCSRNLSKESRRSDGWSSYFWADYIYRFGGFLDIVDISLDSLNNCKSLLKFYLDGNSNYINFYNNENDLKDKEKHYDLIYLDAGDCPNECFKLFEKYKDQADIILIDDAHVKGKKVMDKYPPDTLWSWDHTDHLLCAYGFFAGDIKLSNLEK